jgi:hypothetical protein
VVDAYGVELVVVALREDAEVDPLGLWDGCEAEDADGNVASWLGCEPVMEADGVRIYEVVE